MLYFLHYFLSNFSNYLFPIYAERAHGVPLATTGMLSSFAALISLAVIGAYLAWGKYVTQKKNGLCCWACWLWRSVVRRSR